MISKLRWYKQPSKTVFVPKMVPFLFFFKRRIVEEKVVHYRPVLQYCEEYTDVWLNVPTTEIDNP